MSAFIFLILFAALQNIDNFVLAAAYRLKAVSIPLPPNLLIAVLSGLATGIAVILAGVTKGAASNLGFGSASEVIGRGLLIMIGVWTLIGYFRARLFPQLTDPVKGAADPTTRRCAPQVMRVSEAMIPGIALAVDNIAPSFAFGLQNATHKGITATGFVLAALTAALSVVSVWVGQAVGGQGRNHLRWISPEIASGCLVIAIALLDPGDFAQDWIKQ
jgi:putative Mn2+ efflux pump MntP